MQKDSTVKKGRKNKWLLIFSISLFVILLIYFLGPRPDRTDFSSLTIPPYSSDLKALEDSLKKAESSLPLKPDNEARIIWYQPYVKTAYSFVYLHGNGASQEEGDPVHEALAHRYGCNLFLSRLADHGLLDENPMISIEADEWMQSALNALAVGHQIGEKVILVSTSTGSTLGLYLASRYPDLVDGHIMMSPNIDLYDPRSFILTQPFGLYLARKINGSEFYGWKAPGPAQSYWYTRYRVEGLCTLKSMINCTMEEENFQQVRDPLIMLYYYRDDMNQDKVVSVKRMKEMFAQLGTPDDQKREVAITDAGTHIIGSDIFNQHLDSVWQPIVKFCEEVLNLPPVNDTDWKPFLDKR
jgi:pimeloyl-ACP methyl ester carboxylesterase